MSRNAYLFLRFGWGIIGAFCIIASVMFVLLRVNVLTTYSRTEGKIVGVSPEDYRYIDTDCGTNYNSKYCHDIGYDVNPTIEFIDKSGRVHTGKDSIRHVFQYVDPEIDSKKLIGKQITVYYDPANPESFSTYTFYSFWAEPIVLLLSGLFTIFYFPKILLAIRTFVFTTGDKMANLLGL